jgi:hypothetical protein
MHGNIKNKSLIGPACQREIISKCPLEEIGRNSVIP